MHPHLEFHSFLISKHCQCLCISEIMLGYFIDTIRLTLQCDLHSDAMMIHCHVAFFATKTFF